MMAAPLTQELLERIDRVTAELASAQASYTAGVLGHQQARAEHDDARARLICQGVEGKNEAQREAALHAATAPTRRALFEAEQELAETRGALELAQTRWSAIRYPVRALEAMKATQKR